MTKLRPQPERPAEWDPVYGDKEAFLKAVQEGVASADAGLLVDDEDVWAWVDSWGSENELSMPVPKARRTAG
ncbi:hypothetical protein [Azospirillum sp.]|uniref:hypothetical protein n=1 Tax=Azospirillum sp. TaxID=34012 RepID=UPI002D726FEA|nr:hypothetical protein [Azospirillum sp.]HYD70621.1 hypothetical protein [Azospirillum sp.]